MDKGPRAERPTYTLGEKWVRNDGVYELVRTEHDRYIFFAGPGQEIELTRDLAIARTVSAYQIYAFDPPHTLTWPLEVGKWGVSEGIWRTPSFTSGIRATLAWNVAAKDGIVSLQELYEYVEQQVAQKSRTVGGNQHPVMKGELEGVLPLVKVAR
jgi:hypothetical protein